MIITLQNLSMYCDEEGDCLLWKQGTNDQGYPTARIEGKVQLVSRYIFSSLLGKSLRRGVYISRRCGNRLCVSPECLVARYKSELVAESYRSGNRSAASEYIAKRTSMIRQGRTKLNIELARQIRASVGVKTDELAKAYGVDRSTINDIKSGKTWKESPDRLIGSA